MSAPCFIQVVQSRLNIPVRINVARIASYEPDGHRVGFCVVCPGADGEAATWISADHSAEQIDAAIAKCAPGKVVVVEGGDQ